MKSVFERLLPEEFLAGMFITALLILKLLYGLDQGGQDAMHHSEVWAIGLLVGVNVASLAGRTKLFRVLRDWLPIPLYIAVYVTLMKMIHFVNPYDQDQMLMRIDTLLFGFTASVWLEQFHHPLLSEILYAAYSSLYVVPLLLLWVLYRKSRYREFRNAILAACVGWYIALIGYALVPAVGPGLAFARQYRVEVSGLTPLTEIFAKALQPGVESALRDAFPSMHTGIAVMTMVFAYKYHRKFFWASLPVLLLLIFSTIYLRQHYVIDVLGGVGLAFFSVWMAQRLNRFWYRFSGEMSDEPKASVQTTFKK